MFNQNVPIVVGSSTYNYGLTSIEGGKAIRSNPSATIGQPDVFTISHSSSGKAANVVDRHLVRIDTTFVDSSSGVALQGTASAYVVLVAPHQGASKTDVALAFNKVVSFLNATESGSTATNLERVLNGEP